MPNFRRYYIPNAIIFITTVTRNRAPLFQYDENITLLWDVLKNVHRIYAYHLLAYVILPDHLHWLMRVDEPHADFSVVMKSIKYNFTMEYKRIYGVSSSLSLWQPRFWDHVIRNQTDLERHFDYIHWNPVKHGYAERIEEWQHSSFHFWFEEGYYSDVSRVNKIPDVIAQMDFE